MSGKRSKPERERVLLFQRRQILDEVDEIFLGQRLVEAAGHHRGPNLLPLAGPSVHR